jgi:hypothetical protein
MAPKNLENEHFAIVEAPRGRFRRGVFGKVTLETNATINAAIRIAEDTIT